MWASPKTPESNHIEAIKKNENKFHIYKLLSMKINNERELRENSLLIAKHTSLSFFDLHTYRTTTHTPIEI